MANPEALDAIAKATHGEFVEEHKGARIERMKAFSRCVTLRAFLPSFGSEEEVYIGIDYIGDLEEAALKYLRNKIEEVLG